jgi:hypothetical protein
VKLIRNLPAKAFQDDESSMTLVLITAAIPQLNHLADRRDKNKSAKR